MIEPQTYLLFIAAVVVLVLAPGPDMLYMLTRTIVQGRRAGVLAAVGINAGAYVHVFAAVLGILVWIGIQALRSGPLHLETGKSVHLDGKAIFWQGFLSDVLNPKVAIFFLAFLPQFVQVGNNNETRQLLILGVTGNIIAISINLALVYFASIATAGLRNNRRLALWLNRAMGTVFIALGIRLAREEL